MYIQQDNTESSLRNPHLRRVPFEVHTVCQLQGRCVGRCNFRVLGLSFGGGEQVSSLRRAHRGNFGYLTIQTATATAHSGPKCIWSRFCCSGCVLDCLSDQARYYGGATTVHPECTYGCVRRSKSSRVLCGCQLQQIQLDFNALGAESGGGVGFWTWPGEVRVPEREGAAGECRAENLTQRERLCFTTVGFFLPYICCRS
jgi:hypothetical protein